MGDRGSGREAETNSTGTETGSLSGVYNHPGKGHLPATVGNVRLGKGHLPATVGNVRPSRIPSKGMGRASGSTKTNARMFRLTTETTTITRTGWSTSHTGKKLTHPFTTKSKDNVVKGCFFI